MNRALTETQLREMVPSVFATEAHESRSSRFVAVPTWEIVQQILAEGFIVTKASQSTARDVTKQNFTRHMLRFERPGVTMRVGDTVPQALLVNANDGSSAYAMFLGAFRLVCANGLVIPTRTDASIRVKHSGRDVGQKVIDATYEVIDQAKKALDAPEAWSKITLREHEAVAFAEAGRILRYGDAEGKVETPITAEMLLTARRAEDKGMDLWSTFNRVQENVIRGGISARQRTGHRRRVTTREITGIDQDVRLNKALW